MRLPSADSQLDGHVANVPLREIPEDLHLRKWSARGRSQRRHFLLEFWRSISPPARQALVPNSHLFPVLKSLVLRRTTRREKRNDHLAGNALPGRHIIFVLDPSDLAHDPLRLVPRLGWLCFRIIHPHSFVLPARWKLQRVVRFSNGVRFLKMPSVLQDEWLFFLFVFVPHDVSRICGGDA